MRYQNAMLTIIALLLVSIAISLCRIESNMLDWRPVRTYNIQYDVADCDNLQIYDDYPTEEAND